MVTTVAHTSAVPIRCLRFLTLFPPHRATRAGDAVLYGAIGRFRGIREIGGLGGRADPTGDGRGGQPSTHQVSWPHRPMPSEHQRPARLPEPLSEPDFESDFESDFFQGGCRRPDDLGTQPTSARPEVDLRLVHAGRQGERLRAIVDSSGGRGLHLVSNSSVRPGTVRLKMALRPRRQRLPFSPGDLPDRGLGREGNGDGVGHRARSGPVAANSRSGCDSSASPCCHRVGSDPS